MNNHIVNEWAATFGMNVLIKYKFLFLIIVGLLVFAGFQGMQRVVMDSSNESFLPEGDETVIQNDRFKEIFGNEEFVFILIEADDVFDHKVLTYIRELSEDLEDNLPFVKEVTSLANVEYTEMDDDTLYVEDLIGDDIPTDKQALQEIKRKALSKKTYLDRLITRDAKKTGISMTFEVYPLYAYLPVGRDFSPLDEADWPADKVLMQGDIYTEEQAQRQPELKLSKVADPRKLVAPALRVILDRYQSDRLTVMATGIPVGDYEGERITASEASRFGLIALAASILLLILIFRSLTAIIAPFLVLMSTLILVYGMMGWLQIPMSMTGMIIPPLLLVTSVSYSIHVINHFRQAFQRSGSRQAAIRYAFYQSAWPCFLTALTTAMGFASFLIVPMKPIRDVGVACAFGVFGAYLLVMIIIPTFFSFGKDKPRMQDTLERVSHLTAVNLMTKWADFVIRNALTVGIVSALLLVCLLGCSLKFRVESDFAEILGNKVEFVRNSRYIVKHLGGMYSFEIAIELPEKGLAKDPDVLKILETMTTEVSSWESVTLTASLNDVVKDLNMTMHNSDANYYTIPDDQELIAQYLLLYEMSGGESMEDWVDYEYKMLRLSVQVSEASMDLPDKFPELLRYTKDFPEGTKITVVGDVPILLKVMRLLSYSQIKSVLAALVAITLVMILILKSVKVGLISMIPNVFPVIAITGVMGLLDYPLDLITIMIAPMIIGIAVDDTVHYIVHFKQEFAKSGSYTEANRGTFGKIGSAIVFTSVILTIGFLIFGLSVVKSMLHMAVLSSVGILSALAADLFITPVLFVYFRPFSKKLRERPEENEMVSETV